MSHSYTCVAYGKDLGRFEVKGFDSIPEAMNYIDESFDAKIGFVFSSGRIACHAIVAADTLAIGEILAGAEVKINRGALEKAWKEIHSDCTEEGCSDLCLQVRRALDEYKE